MVVFPWWCRHAWALAVVSLAGCSLLEIGTPTSGHHDAPLADAVIDDAPVADATPIDAPTDTRLDDCCIDLPPTFAGTISLLEVAVLEPGTTGAVFGQGLQIGIAFAIGELAPAPVMEEQPGSPLGCKAWIYTPAEAAVAATGVDEGPIQIESPAGSLMHFAPACAYEPGVGYRCPEPGTQHSGGSIALVGAGRASLTDTAVTFTDGNSLGHQVRISGATNAANNGVFPILAVNGPQSIVYGNPFAVAGSLPVGAVHVNLAGAGVIPGQPDPGFLADTTTVSFVHTAGGGNHIADFTSTTTVTISVGDDFVLAPADRDRLNAIPRDGTSFAIACDAAACPAGSAGVSMLDIVTTDGSTAGLSPFELPAPATKRVLIHCAAIAATAITVPAPYAALLTPAASGATRIQSTFTRAALMAGGPTTITSLSGHALVGFTN